MDDDAGHDDLPAVSRTRDEARAAYDALSRWYDSLAGAGERRFRALVLTMLDVQAGEAVLEIGFGTGHAQAALARATGPTGRVVGLDLSPGMAAVARARLRQAAPARAPALVIGDALRPPFKPDSFDALLMSFTLELFAAQELAPVLRHCRALLRPMGRLGVVGLTATPDPNLMERLYVWVHHQVPKWVDCRPIPAQRLLTAAGFTIEQVAERRMWGLPVAAIVARP